MQALDDATFQSPTLSWTKVWDVSKIQELYEKRESPEVYEIALCLGYIPSRDELQELFDAQELHIWRLRSLESQQEVGLAIDCHPFGDHEMYVWCFSDWDNALVEEALEHMAQRAFARHPDIAAVFTVLPKPWPEGSEDLLLGLGYDAWPSDTDRGLKDSYALERHTFDVYHEEDSDDAPENAP